MNMDSDRSAMFFLSLMTWVSEYHHQSGGVSGSELEPLKFIYLLKKYWLRGSKHPESVCSGCWGVSGWGVDCLRMWPGEACEVRPAPPWQMNTCLEKGASGQGAGVLTVCEGNVNFHCKGTYYKMKITIISEWTCFMVWQWPIHSKYLSSSKAGLGYMRHSFLKKTH